jgi:hypothetical protein
MKGFFGRMFDAVDCEFEFERVKGRVGADCGEGFGDGGWGGVRGEGLDDGVWGGGFEGGGYLVEESARRARRATARLPWEGGRGCERCLCPDGGLDS